MSHFKSQSIPTDIHTCGVHVCSVRTHGVVLKKQEGKSENSTLPSLSTAQNKYLRFQPFNLSVSVEVQYTTISKV